MKANFSKDKTRKDGVQRLCITCTKQYHRSCKEQRNAYERQNTKTDFNFSLICNIRTRTNKAIKAQHLTKTNKTIDLIRCSYSFLRNWTFHHLCGKVTEEGYGSVWTIDHCYLLSTSNLSNGNDM